MDHPVHESCYMHVRLSTHGIHRSDVIKRAKAWKQENLIDALNPIIIGWSNYHRSVVSKEIFSKLDHIVWYMLWRWAKRRHPEKNSKTWVANRYWHTEGTRNWMFSTEKIRLKLFSDMKIVRHTGLKLDKNPYLDAEYFKLRKLRQKALKLSNWYKTRWDKLKDGLCA